MQKINPEIAVELSAQSGHEDYFSSPFFLAANCFYEKTPEETILYIDHPVDKKIRYLYLPKYIQKEDLKYDIQFAREEDIARLQQMNVPIKNSISYEGEYIFEAAKLVNADTPELAKFRQNISHFKRHNSYKILHEYETEKVQEFIRWWGGTKDLSSYTPFAREVFMWDLDLCLKYPRYRDLPQNNIFVEIDGQLAGFAFTHPLSENMFVGLMQKVNIKYRGLSHFIYQEKSKLHPGVPYFTIGTACATPGLGAFKDALRPIQKIPTYLLEIT